MILNELVEYLEDNGVGEAAIDIFIGELPFDKNNILSVMYSPSPEPNKSIPYYTQGVDVWARFTSYDDALNRLNMVMGLLHRKENWETDSFHFYLSYARGMIEDMDRDVERRHLMKLSLAFVYRGIEEFS